MYKRQGQHHARERRRAARGRTGDSNVKGTVVVQRRKRNIAIFRRKRSAVARASDDRLREQMRICLLYTSRCV